MSDEAKLHAGAAVSGDAEIVGDVTVMPRTCIHPKAVIIATSGNPIFIGEGNIIEETARIISTSGPVKIGNFNHMMVGSCIDSCSIGSANVLEPKSSVAAECTIGDRCVVGALVHVAKGTTVPDNTHISGSDNAHRQAEPSAANAAREVPQVLEKELEILHREFNRLPAIKIRKPTVNAD